MIYWGIGGFLLALFFSREAVAEKVEEILPTWNRWDKLFKKYGAKWGVEWKWLKAICINESSLGRAPSVALGLENPKDVNGSKSSDGKSWGLMQVTLTTAKEMDPTATPEKLNNPEYSVNLGAQYLSKMVRLFSKQDPRFLEWVIKSYNQGPGNTFKEKNRQSAGFAHEYWARFQRNLERTKGDE